MLPLKWKETILSVVPVGEVIKLLVFPMGLMLVQVYVLLCFVNRLSRGSLAYFQFLFYPHYI